MEKIWLKRYPSKVPAEIDPDTYSSLVHFFQETCDKFRTQPAFHNLGGTISFDDLDRLSRDFAAFLRRGLKLAKGERVAIMLPNVLQYPVCMYGILRAGLTVANVNPLYKPRELEHQLMDAQATTIVISATSAHVLSEILDKTPIKNIILTELGDLLSFPRSWVVNFVIKYVQKLVPSYRLPGAIGLNAALAQGRSLGFEAVPVTGEDIAFLQYTGGTTGISKGAMLTHRNMVANLLQGSSWLGPWMTAGQEIVITPLPLYHIFSLTVNCMAFMHHGALNVLITNPRDIPRFIKELSKWRFTLMTSVNTLFNALLNHPDFAKLDFSGLKFCIGGGMSVQKSVAQRWQDTTHCPILEGYGLTESSPMITINPGDITAFTGAVGLPVPSTEVSVRDEQGREVGLGEPGELCARGPQVMLGYWQRADETDKVLSEDGWLKTGDIATVDEQGFVRIVDRKKDMIDVSGFKVFPNEVEDVLAMHPAVLEAACIGVPDDKSGEAVKVFVVLKPGAQATADELREHARKNLAGYKVPKYVVFRDTLPKSNVGKILRRELRE